MTVDTTTGVIDAVLLMLGMFMVTTFISLPSSKALLAEVQSDDGLEGEPIVLEWSMDAALPTVLDPGPSVQPVRADTLDWLRASCVSEDRVAAVLQCPPDATHRWCQERMLELQKAADCAWLY